MADEIFKVIFQLEAQGKQVEDEMTRIKSKYVDVNTEMKSQALLLDTLVAKEKILIAEKEKANSVNAVVKYQKEIKKVRDEIEALNRSSEEFGKTQKKNQDQAGGLAKQLQIAFKATSLGALKKQLTETAKQLSTVSEGAKKFLKDLATAAIAPTGKFAELKGQIKLAKDELAAAITSGDADRIQEASERVGKLKDEFNDLNETVNAFASSSKFQQIGNLLSSTGANVLALDFGRARQQSEALLKTTKQLSFKEVTNGIKDMGATLANVGKALLLNPIFLIGTVIVFIIAKFDALKNAGGLIGAIFTGIGRAIDVVIRAGKDLLDFLGLIDATAKSLEELIDIQEEAIKQTENFYNRSIAKRKALNQATIKLENERADAISKALLQELNDTRANLEKKGSSYEDYYNGTKKLQEIGLRASAIAGEKEVRNIQIQIDAQNKLRKLRQDIVKEQNEGRKFQIETTLAPDSAKQIKAEFDLKRKELREQQAEEKRQAAIDFVDFDGGKQARALIDKKFSVIRKNLQKEENKELLDAELKLNIERLEIQRTLEEAQLEISKAQNTLNEEEIAEQKIVIDTKFFNDREALLRASIEKEKKLGLDTTNSRKEKDALFKKDEVDEIKNQDNLSKIRQKKQAEALNEEERHQLELQQLSREARLGFTEFEEDRNIADLELQLEFEKKKLDNLIASGEAQEQEVKNQQNKIEELESETLKAQIDAANIKTIAIIDGIGAILDAQFAADQQIVQSAIDTKDKQIEIQSQRVDAARELADKGNAQLLELEQERLDNLNKEREKFVRVQQTLAAIELISNSAVAVSKAAAQGGVAAPITIATTLIALIAGLASARAIAQQAAFYDGGFTGEGNPRDESTALGRRPYTYHKGEFVMPHDITKKDRNIFEGILGGHIDLQDWSKKVKAFDSFNMMNTQSPIILPPHLVNNTIEFTQLKTQMDQMIKIMGNMGMEFNLDENGFTGRMMGIQARSKYIKDKLAKP